MKQIILGKNDFKRIAEKAHKIWVEEDSRKYEPNFLAYCYDKAIRHYYSMNGWVVGKDGNIYKS